MIIAKLCSAALVVALGAAAATAQVTPSPRNPGDCLSIAEPQQRARCQAVYQPPSPPSIPSVTPPAPAGAVRNSADPNANVKVPSPR